MALHSDAIATSAARIVAAETEVLKNKQAALQKNIQLSRENLAKLNEMRHNLASLFSPIRRLPAEIIGEIIRNVLKTPWILDTSDQVALSKIRRVCKRWDAIARSEGALWRGVKVEREDGDVNWTMLNNWFGRAIEGAHRLCISGPLDFEEDEDEARFISFILTTRTWSELTMELPLPSCQNLVSNLQDKQYTTWNMLTKLSLRIVEVDGDLTDISLDFKTHGLLPSLKELHLSYPVYDEVCVDLPISLSHPTLASLTIWNSCFITAFDDHCSLVVPEDLPQLRDLTLIDIEVVVAGWQGQEHPKIVYPSLQSLSIKGSRSDHKSLDPLKRMTLPGLKTLRLLNLCSWGLTDERIKSIHDFLKRSTSILESLSLEESKLEPKEVAMFINTVASCTDLTISNGEVLLWIPLHTYRKGLVALTRIVSASPFFYGLKKGSQGFNPLILDAFIAMLEFRNDHCTSPPKITLVNPGDLTTTEPLVERLMEFVRSGVVELQQPESEESVL
ncbi:hypothetical protein BKA70DRAFT_1563354 [Coprinopsis sp. MPI-PUGE-AT-0042]|nr:hypothetical protein BKA70DRAFT_1563354 [Coprinopsis sp. MPI-PUGE-AT-0042]